MLVVCPSCSQQFVHPNAVAGSVPITGDSGSIPISFSSIRIGQGQAALLLSFPSTSGKFYSIEESEDLQNWMIREFRVPGTGESIQRFIPARSPKAFLRVSEE